MNEKESTKQIVSRIDERTSLMRVDIGDMKKDLNKLNERTRKNENKISWIIGIGSACAFLISLAVALVVVF